MLELDLVLVARELPLHRAFQDVFSPVARVQVVSQDILAIPNLDAVVSPANSYGWMNGGIDQVYVYAFGQQVERRVQDRIRTDYGGCLPVGEAFVIETNANQLPYLIVAPTMKLPGPIAGTRNPYLAMKAALQAVIAFNRSSPGAIRRLGCPGLGTGTGRVGYREAASQMREAFDEVSGQCFTTSVA